MGENLFQHAKLWQAKFVTDRFAFEGRRNDNAAFDWKQRVGRERAYEVFTNRSARQLYPLWHHVICYLIRTLSEFDWVRCSRSNACDGWKLPRKQSRC